MKKYIFIIFLVIPILSFSATRPLLESNPNYDLLVENQKIGEEQFDNRNKTQNQTRAKMSQYRQSGGKKS